MSEAAPIIVSPGQGPFTPSASLAVTDYAVPVSAATSVHWVFSAMVWICPPQPVERTRLMTSIVPIDTERPAPLAIARRVLNWFPVLRERDAKGA